MNDELTLEDLENKLNKISDVIYFAVTEKNIIKKAIADYKKEHEAKFPYEYKSFGTDYKAQLNSNKQTVIISAESFGIGIFEINKTDLLEIVIRAGWL